ncbi:MAG: nucleotidyltransferase family protein, partial [Prevotella sp.]
HEQSVDGFCSVGIKKLTAIIEDTTNKSSIESIFRENAISDDNMLDLMSPYINIKRQNEEINNAIVGFSKFLKKRNIRFIVFKGQTVAVNYEHPEARRCGDIDFYVCRKDLKNARIMLQRKVSFSDEFSEQHWEFVGDGVKYEMHFRTAIFSLKQNQKYWDDLVENMISDDGYYVEIDGEPIPTFEPTINAVYLFIHIYHHFLKEGIGLRQFCDWMMLLRKHKRDIDCERLDNILEHLGYVKAYKAFGTILVKYLGLKPEEFPYQLSSDDYKWTNKILKVIVEGGNFGKHNRKMQHPGILHSIETGFYSFSHICKFYMLSPKENIRLFPKLLVRSAEKYIN